MIDDRQTKKDQNNPELYTCVTASQSFSIILVVFLEEIRIIVYMSSNMLMIVGIHGKACGLGAILSYLGS